MLYELANFEEYFGPLRLFRYLSFRCAAALITALVIGFIVGPWLIERLRRFKVAQAFRDQKEVGKLADLHSGKKNTPTMGGWMIYIAVVISAILWARWNMLVGLSLFVYTGLTLIGFADDYLKVSRRNSKGLPGRKKLVGQLAIALIVVGTMYYNPATRASLLELWVPFVAEPLWTSMPVWFAVVFYFLVMSGSSNAVNLTDGLDGLAIGCTITATLTFGIFAYCAGNMVISEYLYLSYVPGSGELAVLCTAVVGAGLSFLWFNAPKADVYMGDTGSLALGGLIGTVAFLVHQPFTLVIVGGVFVMEALSVMIQVFFFKRTGKRVFRMAPVHHHFELGGWNETKVVIRFWILSLAFALAGVATLKIR